MHKKNKKASFEDQKVSWRQSFEKKKKPSKIEVFIPRLEKCAL